MHFPINFLTFLQTVGFNPRTVELAGIKVVRSMPRLGSREADTYRRMMLAAQRKPSVRRHVMSSIFRYMQVLHMYAAGAYWDEHPATITPPPANPSSVPPGLVRLPIATSI